MIESMYVAILIGSLLVGVAVFTSIFSTRFGAPLLLVFLLLGLLAGEDGLGIHFGDGRIAYFIGSIALAIILFESGFETRFSAFRAAALPALTLATIGVLVTAGIVGLAARFVFGWDWISAMLLGTIVASTDAAAVFFLLRVGGISLRERVRSSLEVESGSNDPMAIFLTVALVGIATAAEGESEAFLSLLRSFFLQIGVGSLTGLIGGFVIVRIVNRVELEAALYPILVMSLVLVLFAATGIGGASGFLAVYVAGLICGNVRMRQIMALRRVLQGMSWLAQIAMFLTLGLLATPSEFGSVLPPAIAIAAVLIFIARPVAVWLCLVPFGFSRNETAFIAWVGLRGAVSILLAILPMVGGVSHGQTMFNVAFIVVLCSLVLQGWTIAPVARWLGLVVPTRYGPVERIDVELPGRGDHEIVTYRVMPDSAVGRGRRIPRWARPALILRDGRSMRFETAGPLVPGDQVYIIAATEHVRLLDQLFARPADTADTSVLFGDFTIDPGVKLGDLADAYGFELPPEERGETVAAVMRRSLAGDIEEGDRVAAGPVDLIVRRLDDHDGIAEVGLALERRAPRRKLPLFQNRREIVTYLKERRLRKAAARAAALAAAVTSMPLDEEGSR
ncbi:potassium/proton antiporter [Mesorhizobium sp. BR1-1-16]|uniref:potassium/proton antiporter n=1 Tax=Mesorhizobium sp. BR1-1-16 TaxID=2876653 RepID=UPI001CCBFE76|nr:potassium/proton antiporter [Mesorhizobium sp. BR1-1-16]MBZ9935367.1 potassium/proton antiporter [Mesorhizobium sp. BR1-1-16]